MKRILKTILSGILFMPRLDRIDNKLDKIINKI